MLDDPRVNFAISQRGVQAGVNHLGFQVDEANELDEIHSRLAAAGRRACSSRENVSCCYARSDKYWITDPAGIAWETFHTLGTGAHIFRRAGAAREKVPAARQRRSRKGVLLRLKGRTIRRRAFA